MIYNQYITDNLIELFGIQVLTWSKEKIRSDLEDKAISIAEKIVGSDMSPEDYKIENRNYNRIKSLDDQFTELYTKELTN